MKTVVGILTHNAVASLRSGLLERTIMSVETAFPTAHILVLDNGSTDGTADVVRDIASERVIVIPYAPPDGVHTPGRGRNGLAKHFLQLGSDLWVFSDDDIEWKSDAQETLEFLWDLPTDRLALVSAIREPEYPWSKVLGSFTDYRDADRYPDGGVTVEVRMSAPAAAWCFPRTKWPLIGPIPEEDPKREGNVGEDVQVCKRLVEQGHKLGQVDLAQHIGQGYSLCGNDKARTMWRS